jgi:hypothetical protein
MTCEGELPEYSGATCVTKSVGTDEEMGDDASGSTEEVGSQHRPCASPVEASAHVLLLAHCVLLAHTPYNATRGTQVEVAVSQYAVELQLLWDVHDVAHAEPLHA